MTEGIKVKQLIGSVLDMILFAFFIVIAALTNVIVTKNSSNIRIFLFIGAVGFVVGIIACLDSLSIISLDKIKAMFESEEW
jgi:hypothetical protein